MKVAVGALEQVDIRTVWPNEAADFTPWLAENIVMLGQAVGMELEVVDTERTVGNFSADILARSPEDNRMVVVENQFGQTNHDHLGKSLTYGAGLKAYAVVWLSERFRDEHLAVLEWLNDMLGGKVGFFGVEIQVWRIGDSQPAPRFSVVSRPNDWSTTVKQAVQQATLTEGQKVQLDYWQEYAKSLESEDIPFRTSKPGARNWFLHTMGEGNVYLAAVRSTWDSEANSSAGGEIRAELVLNVPEAKKLIELLEPQKGAIESELGEPLTWHNPKHAIMSRLYLRKPVDVSDRDDWPNQHLWLKETLVRLYNVMKPRVSMARKQVATAGGE